MRLKGNRKPHYGREQSTAYWFGDQMFGLIKLWNAPHSHVANTQMQQNWQSFRECSRRQNYLINIIIRYKFSSLFPKPLTHHSLSLLCIHKWSRHSKYIRTFNNQNSYKKNTLTSPNKNENITLSSSSNKTSGRRGTEDMPTIPAMHLRPRHFLWLCPFTARLNTLQHQHNTSPLLTCQHEGQEREGGKQSPHVLHSFHSRVQEEKEEEVDVPSQPASEPRCPRSRHLRPRGSKWGPGSPFSPWIMNTR